MYKESYCFAPFVSRPFDAAPFLVALFLSSCDSFKRRLPPVLSAPFFRETYFSFSYTYAFRLFPLPLLHSLPRANGNIRRDIFHAQRFVPSVDKLNVLMNKFPPMRKLFNPPRLSNRVIFFKKIKRINFY